MRYLVIWLVALAMNVQMFGVTQAAQTYQIPKEAKAAAQRYAKAYEAARDTIDLKHYDVDARAEALDYDVAAADAFVKTQIAYDPYQGVLRGPQGTLAAQAGNAWDQAVTLSALINSMGGEAMIVEGTLSQADAARLIKQTFTPRADLTSAVDINAITAAMQPHLGQAGLDATKTRQEVQRQRAGDTTEKAIETATSALLAALKDSGAALAQSAPADALIAQIAADYVWVQYRDTPNDPWVQSHPAFGSAAAPAAEPVRYLAGTVPDDKLHRITVALEIERFENGKIAKEAIMTPYSRPVANQAGKQIGLSIGPNKPLESAEDEAAFFVPMLNGNTAPGALAFSILGLTAPADEAMNGPEIFATVSNRMGGALNALASQGSGDTQKSIGLAGIVLTVTHTYPNGRSLAAKRYLSDFKADAPQSLGSRTQAISFDGVIDVDIGAENHARDYRTYFASNAKNVSYMPMLAAVTIGKMAVSDFVGQASYDPDYAGKWGEMALLSDIFYPGDLTQDERFVRQGPLVTMKRMHQKTSAQGLLQTTVDIMHHDAIALAQSASGVALAPEVLLKNGVRESIVEGIIIGAPAQTSWVNSPLGQTIKDSAALEGFIAGQSITKAMAQRLRADFAQAGMLVISDHKEALRWWRVSPDTGLSLGMGYQGGAVTLEDLLKRYGSLVLIAIAGGFAGYGAAGCEKTYAGNDEMRACCHGGNIALAAGGVIAGEVAGAALLSSMTNAWLANTGHFIAMLNFEITLDLSSAFVLGDVWNSQVCQRLWGS